MCSEVHLGAFTYLSFTVAERPVFLSGSTKLINLILMPQQRDYGVRVWHMGLTQEKK